jgi:hypothetical protein
MTVVPAAMISFGGDVMFSISSASIVRLESWPTATGTAVILLPFRSSSVFHVRGLFVSMMAGKME